MPNSIIRHRQSCKPSARKGHQSDALRRSVGEQTGNKKPVVRADGKVGGDRAGKQGSPLMHSNSRGAEERRKSA